MPLKYKLEEVLTENSPVTRKVLITYLAKYNVLDYKCAICGNIGEWNGISLTLQIDHINGIRNDNRKENLRWLCPNCHSQTDTYCGKNKTNKEIINFTEEEAIDWISYNTIRSLSYMGDDAPIIMYPIE